MPERPRGRRPRRRLPWIVALLFPGAAAAFWGATGLDGAPASSDAFALVALAGAGGTVAAAGWGRRAVGALVTLGGLLAVWQALAATGAGPGGWLALLGAALLVVAGVLVVGFATRLPALGVRYRAAGARSGSGDPDRDLWNGLSDGRDPTTDDTAGTAENTVGDTSGNVEDDR